MYFPRKTKMKEITFTTMIFIIVINYKEVNDAFSTETGLELVGIVGSVH